MTQHNHIQIFQSQQVRAIWDNTSEEWFFSIVDVVKILTDSKNPNAYWRKLKQRLKAEGNESVTNCHALKMPASDGKMRFTDVADTAQLFRIIQSIPSPKAEPFKIWLAEVGASRINQLQDPELSIQQAVNDYRRAGYSEQWINQRLKGIEIRKILTDEWKRGGVKDNQFAFLTDIMTQQWSGMKTRAYKDFKGLHKESLRDNMTNIELALNMLAEASTTEISKQQNPHSIGHHVNIAKSGGNVAKAAKNELESKLGKSVISPAKASDYLPLDKNKDKSDERQ